MDPRVEALADELVDAGLALEPLEGALLGLPARGRPLADLSAASLDASRATMQSLARRAEELAAGPAGPPGDELDAVTLDLVRFSAANVTDRLSVPSLEFTVTDRFNAPLAGVLSAVPQLPLDSDERRAEHLARLRALPEFLAQAADQLRTGTRSGLTPVARGVRAAIDQIDAVLADPAAGGLRQGADDAFGRDEDAVLRADVEPAVRRYRQALEDESLPVGRDDDHPGLSWLPGGDAMYRTAIRYSTSTDRTPQAIHDLGLELVESGCAAGSSPAVGARLWATDDVEAINRRILEDPALRSRRARRSSARPAPQCSAPRPRRPDWFGLGPHDRLRGLAGPRRARGGRAAAYYFGRGAGRLAARDLLRQHHEARAAQPAHRRGGRVPRGGAGPPLPADDRPGLAGPHLVRRRRATRRTRGLGPLRRAARRGDGALLRRRRPARHARDRRDARCAPRRRHRPARARLDRASGRSTGCAAPRSPMAEIDIVQEIDRYIVTAPARRSPTWWARRASSQRLRRLSADALGGAFSVRDFHDLVLRTGPVAPPAVAAAVERWLARSTAA